MYVIALLTKKIFESAINLKNFSPQRNFLNASKYEITPQRNFRSKLHFPHLCFTVWCSALNETVWSLHRER